MKVNLEFDIETELNPILSLLGRLPISSGLAPVLEMLKSKAEAQLNKSVDEPPKEEPSDAE